ncbi:MAG: metal-dependent hydrolase [Candidatus Thorarchaeota archaeon]
MPFTIFHLGPSLIIGLIFFPYLFLPAILLGSVIVDVEPLAFLLLNLPIVHVFFHTFLGATLMALLVTVVVYLLRGFLSEIMSVFQLPQSASLLTIALAALIGVYSHVILDAFLYPEMQPFWPLLGNPFLGLISSSAVFLICILCFVTAIPVFIFQIWRIRKQPKK